MDELKRTARREAVPSEAGKWRYSSLLPNLEPLSLGEGSTPVRQSRRHPTLFIKDEGANPSGSFAARGIALAVAAAKQAGAQQISIADDGNAAAALVIYAAAAGLRAHVSLPQDVEVANHLQCVAHGAEVSFGKKLSEGEGWFDISAGREPFRLEGLKTMGYELVEQMGWEYPEAVFCPAGVAVRAIWKAFEEMEQLGWVAGRRPRIYVATGANGSEDVIAKSGGRVVEGGDWRDLLLAWGKQEGLLLSPEGAAAAAAYEALLASGELKPDDRVVLFNPAAGLKYAEKTARALRLRSSLPSSLPVGGIITPQ
jgi:threonine synthase